MSRAFFDQIDDEVRCMVGPALRDFNSWRSSRLIKVWYGEEEFHFEVQRLSGLWAPGSGPCLEVGLHLESGQAARNDEVLDRLVGARSGWGAGLKRAEAGAAFGPLSAKWRRLSEVMEIPALDADFADEVAEQLAAYITVLHALLVSGPPDQ